MVVFLFRRGDDSTVKTLDNPKREQRQRVTLANIVAIIGTNELFFPGEGTNAPREHPSLSKSGVIAINFNDLEKYPILEKLPIMPQMRMSPLRQSRHRK